MKNLFYLIPILFLSFLASAQTHSGKLTGTTQDSMGRAVPFASITLNKKMGTNSDENGHFSIANLATGSYRVIVSAVGYQTEEQQINLREGEEKTLLIRLTTSSQVLNEVLVTSRTRTESKANLTNSVSILNSRTLQQQQIVSNNPGDMLALTVPGLGTSSGTSSNWGQTLRGRQLLVLVDGIPQSTPLRNGSVDLRTIDPYVLERVEVIRGATSVYGNGAAGGIVNYITKQNNYAKPFASRTEVVSTGSLISSKRSLGGRLYQSFFGKINKVDYTVSGSFEQNGTLKDAEGDPLGPTYGLSNVETANAFAKVGYDLTSSQRLQLSYNFYSTQDKTDLAEVLGNSQVGVKTTAAPGTILGSPAGTRWNHNAQLTYSYGNVLGKTSLNASAYWQDISTVFFYSPTFEGGGQSTIRSSKKGVRMDLNSPFSLLNNALQGDLSYGVDVLNDVTSQPLLDGRTWVPKMNMTSLAPFLQVQASVLNGLVYNGGLRYESMNIGMPDYTTLKPYNNQTKEFGSSIHVTGGDLKYKYLVFNSGLKYNRLKLFQPYVNFSQGFSVGDLGLVLRAARVNDIAQIQTEAVVVDNYEVGFTTQHQGFTLEASAYLSKSKLGSSFKEVNGFYVVERLPEQVYGYEIALEGKLAKGLMMGASYSYVEGKRDGNDNGKFDDEQDSYLGGERINPPKFTAFLTYSPIAKLLVRLDYLGSGSRNRFAKTDKGIYKTYEGAVRAYHVFNLASSFQLSSSTTVKVGIENLFNANYFPSRSQFLMLDQYYIKGKGTSFSIGLMVDL